MEVLFLIWPKACMSTCTDTHTRECMHTLSHPGEGGHAALLMDPLIFEGLTPSSSFFSLIINSQKQKRAAQYFQILTAHWRTI